MTLRPTLLCANALFCTPLLLLALTACGGGGGGGGAPAQPTGNLTATGLRIVTTDIHAAHEIEFETTVDSTATFGNVNIEYHALLKADVDSNQPEPRQHMLGSFRYATVPVGTSTHSAVIVMPEEASPEGEYYVVARVDPLDEIKETNEDDNLPGENAPDVTIDIHRGNTETSDIVLESMTPDAPAVVISEETVAFQVGTMSNAPNHHFGANVEVSTTGSVICQNIDMSANIRLPDGSLRELQIWDEPNTRYNRSIPIPEIPPGIPQTVHLDFHIPQSLRQTLVGLIRNNGTDTVGLQVRSNFFRGWSQWEGGSRRFANRDDNVIEVPITIIDAAEVVNTGPIRFNESYDKEWANSAFGVGVSLSANSSLDDRGAIADANAKIPFTLFGNRFDLIDLRGYGQSTPQETTRSRFTLDVKSLGQTVYAFDESNVEVTYTNTWSVRKSKEAATTVWVGPVPILVTAGASGTLGFNTTLTLTPASLDLQCGPFAEANAFAQAEINLVVASGGVRGDLTLIRDDLVAHGRIDMTFAGGGTRLQGPVRMELTNTLTGPNGRIYLFVNYPGVKLCKTIIGSLPCGVVTHRKEHTLVKFQSFRKVDTLFADQQFATVQLVN